MRALDGSAGGFFETPFYPWLYVLSRLEVSLSSADAQFCSRAGFVSRKAGSFFFSERKMERGGEAWFLRFVRKGRGRIVEKGGERAGREKGEKN